MGVKYTDKGAVLSPCGTYRYELRRVWHPAGSTCVWVMLNPSTADETNDDATIRRCVAFARDWGHGGLVVVNLYALRATNPSALYGHPDPVGPDNEATLDRWAAAAHTVVAAWGAHGGHRHRGNAVRRRFHLAGRRLTALGVTAHGQPRHPLRLPASRTPLPWPWVEGLPLPAADLAPLVPGVF